jgi:competence protein ComEA
VVEIVFVEREVYEINNTVYGSENNGIIFERRSLRILLLRRYLFCVMTFLLLISLSIFVRYKSAASYEKRRLETRELEKADSWEKEYSTLIHLNTATIKDLIMIPGIGPVIAERIVLYRKQNLFRSINDLLRVSGIGPKKYQKIKQYVTL